MATEDQTYDILNLDTIRKNEPLEGMFSKKVIAEYENPQNVGRMNRHVADGIGEVTGPCGDTMEFYITKSDEKITKMLFMTDGCEPTIACGSMLTRMVLSGTTADAWRLGKAELLRALDGLPEEHLHCVSLAIETLQKALQNANDTKQDRI